MTSLSPCPSSIQPVLRANVLRSKRRTGFGFGSTAIDLCCPLRRDYTWHCLNPFVGAVQPRESGFPALLPILPRLEGQWQPARSPRSPHTPAPHLVAEKHEESSLDSVGD